MTPLLYNELLMLHYSPVNPYSIALHCNAPYSIILFNKLYCNASSLYYYPINHIVMCPYSITVQYTTFQYLFIQLLSRKLRSNVIFFITQQLTTYAFKGFLPRHFPIPHILMWICSITLWTTKFKWSLSPLCNNNLNFLLIASMFEINAMLSVEHPVVQSLLMFLYNKLNSNYLNTSLYTSGKYLLVYIKLYFILHYSTSKTTFLCLYILYFPKINPFKLYGTLNYNMLVHILLPRVLPHPNKLHSAATITHYSPACYIILTNTSL